MRYQKNILSLVVSVFLLTHLSCVQPKTIFESIPEGPWRGVLLLDRTPVVIYGDDRDIKKSFDFDSELPFTFTIGRNEQDSLYIEFENAGEKIRNYHLSVGKATPTAKDTIRIDFPTFDTHIVAVYEDGVMEGNWVVDYKENYMIPFKALYGQNHRFIQPDNSTDTIFQGRWKMLFEPETPDSFYGIGIFDQIGNTVTGTVLTETGDYRYLAGNKMGNKLYLSAFDGAHAFLIQGKLLDGDSIVGSFRSGKHYSAEWLGHRDESFELANAFELTRPVQQQALSFQFPNTDGTIRSVDYAPWQGKMKLIQIMGTWCPNCLDETNMIRQYFDKNSPEDLVWISIAFERYAEKEQALNQLKKYKADQNLSHEILWGGMYKKDEASKQLPFMSELIAYPTLLFVDAENQVRYIHTGFSGPATREYKAFESEFYKIIEMLRHEKK